METGEPQYTILKTAQVNHTVQYRLDKMDLQIGDFNLHYEYD